jgi:hypothetical protein
MFQGVERQCQINFCYLSNQKKNLDDDTVVMIKYANVGENTLSAFWTS